MEFHYNWKGFVSWNRFRTVDWFFRTPKFTTPVVCSPLCILAVTISARLIWDTEMPANQTLLPSQPLTPGMQPLEPAYQTTSPGGRGYAAQQFQPPPLQHDPHPVALPSQQGVCYPTEQSYVVSTCSWPCELRALFLDAYWAFMTFCEASTFLLPLYFFATHSGLQQLVQSSHQGWVRYYYCYKGSHKQIGNMPGGECREVI